MNHRCVELCHCQMLELKSGAGLLHSTLCLAYLSLTELKEQLNNFLHPKELAYFQTLSFERRQKSYLLGRFVAKQAITHYKSGLSPTEILIDYGVFQYPIVYYPGKHKIHISYSHSEQCGIALAFPENHPMGIDLEVIDTEKNEVIATQLTQEEKSLITTLHDPLPARTYALFWTIKEALSKTLHTGLTSPFEIYAVKQLQLKNNYWVSEFKNFTQYQALSFSLGKFICSIVYPRRTQMTINIDSMQQWLARKCHP